MTGRAKTNYRHAPQADGPRQVLSPTRPLRKPLASVLAATYEELEAHGWATTDQPDIPADWRVRKGPTWRHPDEAASDALVLYEDECPPTFPKRFRKTLRRGRRI